MTRIRHVSIERFRGFDAFETVFRDNVILVGEPGAGRSDLVDAIARVLEPAVTRPRLASELDFHDLDLAQPVYVELTMADLPPSISTAFTRYLEIWDFEDETIRTSLVPPDRFDNSRHEFAVRLGYRIWVEEEGVRDGLYWPKFADRASGTYPNVRSVERAQIPFLFQRGLGTQPLDLAPRGDFRAMVAKQATASTFATAVTAFMAAVETGAEVFASNPAVSAALEEVLQEIRQARRFDETRAGTEILAFLPDGGSEAGLMRSLAAVASLDGAPPNLATVRHGASISAALRGGLLTASARRVPGTIVVVEDLGGEIDPHLARHLAARIRSQSGQLIASSRLGAVIEAFAPEEVLRLHVRDGRRIASAGVRPRTKPQRLAARYYARYLVPALHASTALIVEGHTDRLGFGALADKALELGRLGSMDAAGIAMIEAGTDGQAPRLADAAKQLGLFTIVVLDNANNSPAASDPVVRAATASSDSVVRLPPRTSVERALLEGVDRAEVVRVFNEIDVAVGGLSLPPGWETMTGSRLVATLSKVMHDRSGSIHAIYVEALSPDHLPPVAMTLLETVLSIGRAFGPTGLTQL